MSAKFGNLLALLVFFFASLVLSTPSDKIFSPPWEEEKATSIATTERSGYSSGSIVTPILGASDSSRDMRLLDPGVIIAGYAGNGSDTSIAFARYTNIGELDTAFNTAGIFTADLTAGEDMVHAYLQDPFLSGQKRFFAGRSINGSGVVNTLVGRLTTAGRLDTSFFSSGTRIGSFNNGGEVYRAIYPANPSGRVFFASGYTYLAHFRFLLGAYLIDGRLDTAFNTQGFRSIDMSNYDNGALAMHVDSNVRPLLVGPAYNGTDWDFAIARLKTNGTLDTSFGTDGKEVTGVLSADDKVYSSALIGGTHVLAGYAFNGSDNDIALVRYDSSGALDTSFNTTGKTTLDASTNDDVAFGVFGDPLTSKIYSAGSVDNAGNLDVLVVRYNTDGILDTSFHTNGWNTFDVVGGNDIGINIQLTTGSRMPYIGARVVNGGNFDFAHLRIHTDGSLARSGDVLVSFGTEGKVITDPTGGIDAIYSAQIRAGAPTSTTPIIGVGVAGNDGIFVRVDLSGGGLQTSFSTDGIDIVDLGGTETFRGVQSVAQGMNYFYYAVGDDASDFLVVKFYNESLDTTFSTSGYKRIDFNGTDIAYAMDTGGVIVGRDGSTPTNLAVAAVNISLTGALMTSFDTDGKKTFSFGSNAVGKETTRLISRYFIGAEDSSDWKVLLLSTSGALSTSFNTTGLLTVDFGGTDTLRGSYFYSSSETLSRWYLVGGNGSDLCVARIHSAGLDTSFNTTGTVTLDFGGGSERGGGIVFRTETGRIYVTGDNGSDFLFARFLSDGALDTGFGAGGKTVLDGSGVDANYSLGTNLTGDVCAIGSANGDLSLAIGCIAQ